MTKVNSFVLSEADNLYIEIEVDFPSILEFVNHSEALASEMLPSKKNKYNDKGDLILAILLHPYGPLGGSKDDHLIRKISSKLSQKAIVAVPNLRGVGGSQGRTSWTAEGECQDLNYILQAFLLPQKESLWKNSSIPQILSSDFGYNYSKILLIGYSYGSMIASSVTQNTILNILASKNFKEPRVLSNATCPSLCTILLSYPLSTAWALSLWNLSTFKNYISLLVSSIRCSSESASIGRLLVIFGLRDQFSSYSSYNAWLRKHGINLSIDLINETAFESEPIQAIANSQADHFWGIKTHSEWLVQVIFQWLEL